MTSTLSGVAQASARLSITGTSLPPACKLNVQGSGTFDYSAISNAQLSRNQPTYIGERQQRFSVNCPDPVRMVLSVRDNRRDMVVPALVKLIPGLRKEIDDEYAYGLGTTRGQRVGSYVVRLWPDSISADYQGVALLWKWNVNPIGSSWGWSFDGAFDAKARYGISFSVEKSNQLPSPVRNLDGLIGVQAVINKTANFPNGEEIRFFGLSTLELVYW